MDMIKMPMLIMMMVNVFMAIFSPKITGYLIFQNNSMLIDGLKCSIQKIQHSHVTEGIKKSKNQIRHFIQLG